MRGLREYRLRRACRKIRELRTLLSTSTYELAPLTSDDDALRGQLDAHAANGELVAGGYRLLGDLRLVSEESASRYFVSPNELNLVSFNTARRDHIVVESATVTGIFSTRVRPLGSLAVPPTHQTQPLPKPLGVHGTVAQHEKWFSHLRAMTEGPPELLPWRSLDAVIEQSRKQHERLMTWRNSVNDDTLLDLDLRCLLLAAYDTNRERFRRHLVATPPQAKVRPLRTKI